jgi:hypothetical protein
MNLQEPFCIEIVGPAGTVTFRLPYPDETFWLERAKRQRVERTSKAGQSRFRITPCREFDYQQVLTTATEKPDEFDDYDAELVIARLSNCDLTSHEQMTPSTHKFEIKAFGGAECFAVLGYPSRRQVVQFREATSDSYSTKGGATTILSLTPTVNLFRALLKDTGGYDGGAVPVPHMDTYIQQLLDIVDPNG